MDKSTRNLIQKATQDARQLLETEFSQQLEALFDILPDGTIAPEPGKHLDATQRIVRQKIVAAIEHEKASGVSDGESVTAYLREVSFTYLNRFVALKMLEAQGLAQECVSKGEQSSGFKEFSGLAPGLAELPDRGYRLYIESLFDELSIEIRVLFDRQNPASLLWPRRKVLDELLSILNREEIRDIWSEDETIGWVYQYFNSGEERKKMRDESAAPQNSRELAVRNQFFTPRYVVEFLTDNTLGRIWYEMRKGNTALKAECRYLVRRPNEIFLAPGEKAPSESERETDLSQEKLLKKPVHIQHRPKKDPRDLRVLDPACGSGHFLLYAFDLLERIYEEAWKDSESPQSEATDHTLHEDFETLDDLRRVVSKLIIEHNLHGIDIDPRAVQIAALALWLHAQKTWKNHGIKAAERPGVTRSNIVTAEPMPGEEDMCYEFTSSLKPRVLGQLVDVVFDKMKLAGEAGSLLKIEEEIKTSVAKARKQWLESPKPEQQLLFPGMAEPRLKQQELRFDFKGVTDEGFWEKAEDRILDALKEYAERTENGHAIRRRLFAQDAARGFAFIDLCRKRYNVVLMNPPFGEYPHSFKEISKRRYHSGGHDILTAFIERGLILEEQNGLLGAITSRTVFFMTTTKNWRENVYLDNQNSVWVELGEGVLDEAMVETCMYVVQHTKPHESSLFINPGSNELTDIILSLSATNKPGMNTVYTLDQRSLSVLPGSPLAYWVSPNILSCFKNLPSLDENNICVRVGLQTGDDFRFIRCWWEVPVNRTVWFPHAKGGENLPYATDIHLVLNWQDNGSEMRSQSSIRLNMYAKNDPEDGLEKGLTFPYRTYRFSPALMPVGVIAGVAGMGIYSNTVDPYLLVALLNTSVINEFIDTRLGRLEMDSLYQAGTISPIPFPEIPYENSFKLIDFGKELYKRAYRRLSFKEEFLLYTLPGFNEIKSLESWTKQNQEIWSRSKNAIISTYSEVEKITSTLYKLPHHLVESIKEKHFFRFKQSLETNKLDKKYFTKTLFNIALGIVFGRWDVRLALDPSLTPKLPDPLDPLPVCPPGMLVGPDGLPAEPGRIVSEEWLRSRQDANTLPVEDTVKDPTIPDSDYPLHISWDGILVDDPGFEGGQLHDQDIVLRTREMLEILLEDKAHAIERETCEILSVPDLRNYFRKSFFKDHIKHYTKSRRKAPIYWQLSTPSATYSIWLYYHRFTKDTFYKVLNENVIPKLQFEERELTNIRQQYGASPTAKQRKEITAREAFVAELTAFKEEVARIAPLWNPNLNDGVIINFAPIWRFVPQNKPWQKECKKVWDKLVNGDYDWAHLAIHLWPERVVKKCTKDRSLAIAHGLEKTFWEEDDKGKWKPRKISKETMDSLIQDRTSSAVKAALEDFLKVPIPANMAGKKRKMKT